MHIFYSFPAVLFLFISSVNGQVNDKKLDEVAKLRQELTEKLSPVIKVTPSKQAEVDAIRNEILNAVNNQKYKTPSVSSALPPVLDAKASKDAKDPVVGSPLWDRINNSRKNIYELVSSNHSETEVPNTMKFLGKFNLHSNSYRDVIDLVEVQENLHYEFEEPVVLWRTIPHSMSGNKHLLLGLTNTSLILAKLVDGIFHLVDEMKINETGLNYNGFEAFLHWNNKDGQSEGYAILATSEGLLWVRLGVDGEFNKLEVTWHWSIHKVIHKFKYFKHNNDSLIFLITRNSANLEVYRFSLDNKDFSQVQLIRLGVPCKNIALVEWKKQLFLALPLNDTTVFYKYADTFSLIKTVKSKGVTSVVGFQAGGLCFFAIAGEDPQILRYRHNGLDQVQVLSKVYSFVRSYFPIPIHTFRDDVILLVEFEVAFDTHTLSRISTLRWNGEAFEAFFNVPCYMEEVLHYNGVTCLIDSDQSSGLTGAVILSRSNNVSILVPRNNARSGLFDLKIEIRAAPHPKEEKLIEIQMMFDYFNTLKEYNGAVFQNAMKAIENAVLPGKPLVVTGGWTVDEMHANEIIPEEGVIKKMMNGSSKAGNVTSDDLIPLVNATTYEILGIMNMLDKAVPEEAEIEARNNAEQLSPQLQLHGIRAKEIFCDNINGVSMDDVVWKLEDALNLSSPLEVQTLTVLNGFTGRVNGINITKDLISAQNNVIHGNALFAHLELQRLSSTTDINGGLLEAISRSGNYLRNITTEELYVENDFVVDNINGVDWLTASQQMIRRDLSPRNTTLIVDGNVIIESDATIDQLNGDPFVGNYVWDEEDEFMSVVGKKEFRASVVASSIDMEDRKIDGVAPSRLISLAGGAYLPNETTFGDQLELLHGLIVTNSSNIEGPHMDQFLSNPTLQQERLVKASCDFRNLRVDGKIIVRGNVNGLDIKSELEKYLYITEQPMQVNGFKEFKSLQVNDLNTNLVNGRDVSTFATLDTEQTLNISQMIGKSFNFASMQLNGLFDFVNITELVDKSIRTTGDQVTEAHVIFTSTEGSNLFTPQVSMTAKNLIIQNALNTFPAADFIDHTNILEYKGMIEGAEIHVDRLYMKGTLQGPAVINGESLEDFNTHRLSKSSDQIITVPTFIQSVINSEFQLTRINSMGQKELVEALDKFRNFSDHFQNHHIDELCVESSANMEHINNVDLRHLIGNVIWLNQSNEFSFDVSCLDEIRAEDTVVINRLFGESDYMSRVLWRNQTNEIRLSGPIRFKRGLVVEGNIETPNVNGLSTERILTKSNPRVYEDVILGRTLKVHSQLVAKHWNLFDNFRAEDLSKMYKYDPERDIHEIRSDRVTMKTAAVIPHLIVSGKLNEIPNIADFLNSIVSVDDPRIILKVPKTNMQKIFFQNLQVEFINDMHLEEFMRHAVVRSAGSTTKQITGKVQFSNIVETSSFTAAELTVDLINGWTAERFFGDTVQLSSPYLWKDPVQITASSSKFESITLLQQLNGVPFDKFDLTTRDHHLPGNSIVHNMIIDSFVAVGGLVNSMKLELEEHNSLLKFRPIQTVTARSTFDKIRVMNSLTIEGFVNGRNFSLIIPITGQDIHIESPITFAHLQTHQLSTAHWITGMNFSSWYENTVKYHDTELQVVNGFWQVNQLTVKDSIQGDDYINGRKLKSFLEAYENNRLFLQQYESELQFAYWKMCSQVKQYFSSPLRVGCSFKHLDDPDDISVIGVSSILIFRHLDQYYLIYSAGCSSHLLIWNTTSFREVDVIASGSIIKWTYVPSNSERMHLVAQNGEFCPNIHVNGVWAWNAHKRLVLVKQLCTEAMGDVHTNPLKRNFFYITIGDRVQEIRVPEVQVSNELVLGGGSISYWRFIPSAHDSLEVLVTNGMEIHTMKIKPSNRYKRHFLKFGARSKRLEENYRMINQMALMNKSAFIKLAKDEILAGKTNTNIQPLSQESDSSHSGKIRIMNSNGTDPSVGGAIFDDIQNTIQDGAELFTDSSADVLKHFDSKYDVEGILDALEDKLLTSTATGSREKEGEVVSGALFDNIQNTIQDGSEMFVDVSENVLEDLDKIIDLEELFQRSGQELKMQDVHIGNQSADYRHQLTRVDDSFTKHSTTILSNDAEVVALNVGAGRQIRTLFGVYNSKKSTTGSDLILIYEDLFIDRPFQTIPCHKPSSLIAWQMDQETLLIFLEDKIKVDLPSPVDYLRTAILPWAPCGCLTHFLVAVSPRGLTLMKAETVGHCINEVIDCNEY